MSGIEPWKCIFRKPARTTLSRVLSFVDMALCTHRRGIVRTGGQHRNPQLALKHCVKGRWRDMSDITAVTRNQYIAIAKLKKSSCPGF
jgi:hypothetical protein